MFKHICTLLLCVFLCFVCRETGLAMETTIESVNVQSASFLINHSEIDGMVRVYLSSLGDPTELTLKPVGSYSINGDVNQNLQSEQNIQISYSTQTGNITLYANGTTQNMGDSFSLRRHSTSQNNGIYIHQALSNYNPYPGDISFTTVRQSNGQYRLYTIAHIFIEDYLLGVLPFEMGNNNHIEALKAQAIVARTYTIRMMEDKTQGLYDVVDTSSDQVYRGTPTGNENCKIAIHTTKGIVLKNDGMYTATYYSTSNGGQIESIKNAWGTNGYSYLSVKDDPFDFANSKSTVKSITLPFQLQNPSIPLAFSQLLTQKVILALQALGQNSNSSNTQLQTLLAIKPHTPKYASPSKLYTKMDFTVLANSPTGTSTITVTFDIFNELESLFNLSIQSNSNELWTVIKNNDSFTISARRFGHGIGMSQRGAMHMAKLGYTYDEIVGFYYHGCVRVQINFTNTILDGNGGTVTEVVDPSELENNSNQAKGSVHFSNPLSSVAIMNSKSTQGQVLIPLENGAIVTVLFNDGQWCFVKYGKIKGYIPTELLTITGTPTGKEENPSSVMGFAKVTANVSVNLRKEPTTNSNILSSAPKDALLVVFNKNGSWAEVQYNALNAYVHSDYISSITQTLPTDNNFPPLTFATPAPTKKPTATHQRPSQVLMNAVVATESGWLNMREFPQVGSAVLATLSKGTRVSVYEKLSDWYGIEYNGKYGYVMRSFIVAEGEQTPTPSLSGPAYVNTQSGWLNLRVSPEVGSKLVTTIPQYANLTVHSTQNNWSNVTYQNKSGYVMTMFLKAGNSPRPPVITTPKPTAPPIPSGNTAVVNTYSGMLNLRREPIIGSPILAQIKAGTVLQILDRQDYWSKTTYNGHIGYVMNSFLRFSQSYSKVAYVDTPSGGLNLRETDSLDAYVKTIIPRNAQVTLLNRGEVWSNIEYKQMKGFVLSSFLRFNSPPSPTPMPPMPTQNAWVSTISGNLNMRSLPLITGKFITSIPRFAMVTVHSTNNGWSYVSYNQFSGYVMSEFLSYNPPTTLIPPTFFPPQPTIMPTTSTWTTFVETTYATVSPTYGHTLDILASDSSYSSTIMILPVGYKVQLLAINATWARIIANGMTGYCHNDQLKVTP